jgi:hypothetical protein
MLKLRRGTLEIPVISALDAIHTVMHEVTVGGLAADGYEAVAADSILSFLVLHLRERTCEIPEELDVHVDVLGHYMEMPK